MERRHWLSILVPILLIGTVRAEDPPESGPHAPSQVAADALRAFAGTDGAFLAAGLIKPTFQRDRLETLLQYPTDEVVVVNLTGAQVREALERSLALFPQPNSSFLQLSGFEVTFSRSAAPNARILSVTASGAPLEAGKTYSVAMPSSLGRGGLGYFKVWDRSRIAKTFAGTTMESVLRGKRAVESAPRWLARP